MPYIWSMQDKEDIPPELLALAQGDTLVARLLMNRGVRDTELAGYFLEVESMQESSALEIPDMDKALGRVDQALELKQRICIFGDYDVDGTSSVALLYRCFKILGHEVNYYIPHRQNEGYGLNQQAMEYIRNELGCSLLISCDCGISNYVEVEFANTIGLDVIITDHHALPKIQPPSIANCNPKTLPEKHPLHYLPGVGVAYKLAEELLKQSLEPKQAKAYSRDLLDLVALGMVADMAPLKSENRLLTIEGLKVLARTSKAGLQELLKISGVKLDPDAEHIGFGLAPRINAAGRLNDAINAARLMITDNQDEALMLSQELDRSNKERQRLCEETFEGALELIMEQPQILKNNVIVLAKADWHHGIIGIVASRLLERFHLPVFMIAIEEGVAKGSVRCINLPHLDIYDEMSKIQERTSLFLKFGGHKMAAGFSCKLHDLDALIQAINEHFRLYLDGENLTKTIRVDSALRLKELSLKFLQRINKLAPFGVENPQPVFVAENLQIQRYRQLGNDGKHLKLFVREPGNSRPYEALLWNRADEFLENFDTSELIALAFTPKLNDFGGEKSIQLDIRDWQLNSVVDPQFFARFRNPVSVIR